MIDRIRNWVTFNPELVSAIAALMIAAFLALAFTTVAWSATATIDWTNATQREDGSALAPGELAETQIEYAKCTAPAGSGQPTWPATIDGVKTVAFPGTTVAIADLAYGTWCFRARHKDSGGLLSAYTGVVWSKYLAPPKPPTLLTVKGIVWEMKQHPSDGPYLARVVGSVEAGKPCYGLAPQIGFDLFTVERADVTLNKGMKPSGMLVAQCVIS